MKNRTVNENSDKSIEILKIKKQSLKKRKKNFIFDRK